MAQCMTPFGVRHKHKNETIPVPCGRCPACRARRASAWSFRLMQEDKVSISSFFITLTYDTSVVPISKSGYMDLRKRDLQLFFKRLRKAHTLEPRDRPIRYYAVGEYGGKTNRPHYHVILFNSRVELIQPAWQNGHVHYGQVTGASVGYTLKYISKPGRIPMHRNDDRTPEFSLMSKGLGANYLTDAMVKWHKADLDERMYCVIEDGKKITLPRYYKDKIYTEHERKRVAFFQQKKMCIEKAELEQKMYDDPILRHNQVEAHKAAYKRMAIKSTKGDKL